MLRLRAARSEEESIIQLSTAMSDGVLMLAAFAACIWLRRRGERYTSTGFLLIGIAAFIGAVRFSINPELAELHGFVSDLATCTGLPLIGVQYLATCYGWPGPDGRMTTMGASVVGFAAFGLAFPVPLYGTIVGAISMGLVIAGAIRCLPLHPARASRAIGGAVAFIVAGLAVGTQGTLGPFLRVDVFHGILVLAIAGLTTGLPVRGPDAVV
ncbi:MAG: hypothetical protein R3F61_26105 [Myxococcota bacterium]